MELRQIKTFRAVATTLSFTRAAEALDYAQSSVTAQVQALEEELRVPLFERLGKRVILTEAGQRLLVYADKMLKLAQEAREAVASDVEPQGALTVGAPESLCVYRLPPVLQQFRVRFPRVRLVFRPVVATAEMYRALHDGRMDVCFLLENAVADDALTGERLVAEPLRILAHPEHPLARRTRVAPGDLEGEPLLLTEPGCSYRVPFERALAAAGCCPGSVMEFGSVEAIKQCVIAGMGIAILPEVAIAAEIAQGRLAALDWVGPVCSIGTQMVWHKDKWLSPALRAFLDVAREVLTPTTPTTPIGTA